MPEKNSSPTWLVIVGWLIIASPIGLYLWHLPNFGPIQSNDYYGILPLIVDGESVTSDPVRWLMLKSNEHRAGLPILFYVLNMALTDGHNLGLSIFALGLMLLVLVLVVRLLPDDVREDPWARVGFGFGLAMFCLTPVAAHNVALGFSGTIWFFANVLAVAAIGSLTRRAERKTVLSLWPVVLFGVLAAFTHSTHLALWPALLAGGIYLRLGLRRWLALLGSALFVALLFVTSYYTPSYHPDPETSDLAGLLRYTATYLGSLFSSKAEIAQTMGWIGLTLWFLGLAAVIDTWRAPADLRRDLAPWLMLQLYGLGNATLTAISRAGFGENQALSSRYATLAACFWIGLLTPLALFAWRRRPQVQRWIGMAAVTLVVAAMGLAMLGRGGKMLANFADRGSRHGVAALAMVHGIHDNALLAKVITPAPDQIWKMRSFLKANEQVPFHRPLDNPLGHVETAPRAEQPHPGVGGYVDQFTVLSNGIVRVGGWAVAKDVEITEVLFLGAGGKVVGQAARHIHRRDVQRGFDPQALSSGWEGYAQTHVGDTDFAVYLRIAGDPKIYPHVLTGHVAQLIRPKS